MLTREEAIRSLQGIKGKKLILFDYQIDDIIELLKQQPEQPHSHPKCADPFCGKCGSYSEQSEQPRRKVVGTFALYLSADEIIVFRTCDDGEVFINWFTLNKLKFNLVNDRLPPIPQDDK